MDKLKKVLNVIDGKGYKAYKDIQGTYEFERFTLYIDYIQGDPFANPSRIRLKIAKDAFLYQKDWYEAPHRKVAFEDFLAREVSKSIDQLPKTSHGSGKSGLISIDSPRQEILPRTAIEIDNKAIEIRLSIGLPAQGRKVLGKAAVKMLLYDLTTIVNRSIFQLNQLDLMKYLYLADQQAFIRSFLQKNNLLCFIANGSILPRESGVSSKPLKTEDVVPFVSPPSLEIEISLPHQKRVKGMALPQGISLIVGGGYHGKSTLLKAIERGIYNHRLGDGREFVITNNTAFKVRAEDGRRVEKVNISPFINNLPFHKDTTHFSSDDASGSTSQATNIIEALEIGAELILIDEDTSATNFMIRDARMQELVGKEKEPITPFIDKVRQLYDDYNVSTILVIGGTGDYFDVADIIIMMDEYKPYDLTKEAKEIASKYASKRINEGGSNFGILNKRIVEKRSLNPYLGKREKVDAKGLFKILYGNTEIDLSFLEQLVDSSQTRAIAWMIRYLWVKNQSQHFSLAEGIHNLYQEIEHQGLEVISPYTGKHPGDLALPRKLEVAASINRMRSLIVKQKG